MLTVTFRPGFGPPCLVSLCSLCCLGRPSRKQTELGSADLAWRALERDVTRLLAGHEQGLWSPSNGELEFAAGVARMPWSEESMRTAVREAHSLACSGRLVRALDKNAFVVLRHVPADDPALHSLRRLVDLLATEAERSRGGGLPPGAA
ncbi:hypothetical protein ACFVRB_27835 [Streptomyces nojiriensis]|uniref:hypothetical protein n=1 Tax=Streptomyces nojiriensis TaxID=66374 RepID=UPI0036DE56C8